MKSCKKIRLYNRKLDRFYWVLHFKKTGETIISDRNPCRPKRYVLNRYQLLKDYQKGKIMLFRESKCCFGMTCMNFHVIIQKIYKNKNYHAKAYVYKDFTSEGNFIGEYKICLKNLLKKCGNYINTY